MSNEAASANSPKKPTARSRWSKILLLLLVTGGVALSVLAVKWRATLRVQRIDVEGANAVSAKDIVALSKITARASMYTLNLAEIRDRVSHHPFILSANVYRQLPNVITIGVVERVPVAAINCGQLCYTDKDGVLLPYNESNKKFDLPLLSGIEGLQNARPGTALMNKELLNAIGICQTAQSLDTAIYHMISEVNMNNCGDVILYSAEAGVPVIIGRDDIARKLLLLEDFWKSNVHIGDVESMRYIDLRFRDQVVVKWAERDQQSKKASL